MSLNWQMGVRSLTLDCSSLPHFQGETRMKSSQPASTANQPVGPEKEVGVWEGTRASIGFWLKSILTLSIYYFLFHRFNKITLTTRRVTQQRGNFLSQNETSLGLHNVTDITINRSFIGRMFNYGDITIQSAGSGSSEIQFTALSNPEKLRELIYDLRDGRVDEESL